MKFQGAGEITVARRNPDTGFAASAFRSFGCVDVFDPKFSVEKGTPHIERCSGLGGTDYQGIKSRSGTLDLAFTEWNVRNIAFMLGGTIVEPGATDTADPETLPDGFENGDSWHLGANGAVTHQAITALVIKDSASPQITLVAGEHYLLDPVYGTVKFIDIAALTQPFVTNAYGFTNAGGVAIFKNVSDEYIVRVNSKNVASNLAKGVGEFYRAQFDPPSSFPLIGEDFATFSLSANLYQDLTREVDAEWGQFGRMLPTLA